MGLPRIEVVISNVPILALADTGVGVDAISTDMAQKLGLKMAPHKGKACRRFNGNEVTPIARQKSMLGTKDGE